MAPLGPLDGPGRGERRRGGGSPVGRSFRRPLQTRRDGQHLSARSCPLGVPGRAGGGGVMKAGTCKHFNGIQNDRCKLGIAYASVRTDHDHVPSRFGGTTTRSLPCISDDNHGGTTCPLYEEPTAEEL